VIGKLIDYSEATIHKTPAQKSRMQQSSDRWLTQKHPIISQL